MFLKSLDLKSKVHNVSNFTFENGESFQECLVEYSAFGTIKRNDNDEIINAVVFIHGIGVNFSSIENLKVLFDKNKSFDLNEYFIIAITSLGTPNTISSSNFKSKNFPDYTLNDMINLKKVFLKEKFNISHLNGIIGYSFGGFEALKWACDYPDDLDFLISLCSSYKTSGINYFIFKIIKDIASMTGDFNKAIGIANAVFFPYGLSKEFLKNMENEEIDNNLNLLYEDINYDPKDIIQRSNVAMSFDLTDDLDKIKSKVLIIAINQDEIFPLNFEAVPMESKIKNSKLITFDSIYGHLGINEIFKVDKQIQNFLNNDI
ncbi:MAG: alpha/beta fold hydrolase [Methanobrevibacter sp.]|jgi:homoserine O-acetyltransferase|nr:alpha/beta fold hydrolase [Candidatus Methanoflexus mossambicus]